MTWRGRVAIVDLLKSEQLIIDMKYATWWRHALGQQTRVEEHANGTAGATMKFLTSHLVINTQLSMSALESDVSKNIGLDRYFSDTFWLLRRAVVQIPLVLHLLASLFVSDVLRADYALTDNNVYVSAGGAVAGWFLAENMAEGAVLKGEQAKFGDLHTQFLAYRSEEDCTKTQTSLVLNDKSNAAGGKKCQHTTLRL